MRHFSLLLAGLFLASFGLITPVFGQGNRTPTPTPMPSSTTPTTSFAVAPVSPGTGGATILPAPTPISGGGGGNNLQPSPTPISGGGGGVTTQAVNKDWTGAVSIDFENGGNWSGGTIPTSDLTTNIGHFTGTPTANQPQITATRSIAGLLFDTAAGGWTLSSSSTSNILTLGSSGLSTIGQNSGLNTISANVALGAIQNFSVGTGGSLTISGIISGTSALAITGAGTLTFSGNNTYVTGGTTLAAGTLNLGSAQTGTGGPLGGSGTVASIGIVKFTGGTLQYSASNTTDYSSRFSNSAGQAFSIDTNGQSVTFASQIISTASGAAGTLTKLGAGTLTLTSAASRYTGATTIDGGTLTASTIANGGSDSSIGRSTNAAANLVFGGGTLQYTGSTAQSTDRLFTIGDASGNSATLDASGGAVGTLSFTNGGAIAFGNTNAHTLTLTGTNTGNNTLAASIGDNTGATSVVKTGGGTWVLSGSNTYTGGTTVSAGLLQLTSTSALGSSSGSLTVNGGVLNFNDQSINVGNLTGTGGTIWNNLATALVTLTIGNGNTGGGNYAGVIADRNVGVGTGTGAVALTKTGTETITLSGANTYTGATTVNGGTLLVNGSGSTAAGSAVSVNNSGTTLGGTGTINGTVTVGAGANLLGGTGASATGSLTLTNTVNTSAGIIELALGAPGAHSTLAHTGAGAWTFGTTQTFTFIDLGAAAGTYTNIISGLTSDPLTEGAWTITNAGFIGTFTFNGGLGAGGIDLTLIAVPEPSTWVAGVLTLAAIGYSQRRRLKRSRKLLKVGSLK